MTKNEADFIYLGVGVAVNFNWGSRALKKISIVNIDTLLYSTVVIAATLYVSDNQHSSQMHKYRHTPRVSSAFSVFQMVSLFVGPRVFVSCTRGR